VPRQEKGKNATWQRKTTQHSKKLGRAKERATRKEAAMPVGHVPLDVKGEARLTSEKKRKGDHTNEKKGLGPGSRKKEVPI